MEIAALVLASDDGWLCFAIPIGLWIVVSLFGNSNSSGSSSPNRAPASGGGYTPPPRQPRHVPDFEVKCESDTVGKGAEKEEVWKVFCQGRVPVSSSQDVTFLVTVKDRSTGASKSPLVTCLINRFRDEETGAYRDSRDGGNFSPGTFISSWVCVGLLPIKHMAAAYSGNRRLEVTCTAVPTYVSKQPLNSRTLWSQAICSAQASLVVDLEMPGYLEREEKSRDAKALIVEVALACAHADGSIDERELKAVSRWMRATLSQMDEDDQDEVTKTRAALNAAFKKGSSGQVRLEEALKSLKACKLAPMNQQALALCVEVIAADGVLHDDELASVRKIAASLGIDYARLQALMDKQFIQAGITVAADNLEALVGVDPAWDKEKIRKHLSEQFQKWNARAPNAKTTEDQARIRSILDAIAKLRKKYS